MDYIKKHNFKYFPETKEELKDIIKKRIKTEGKEVDLKPAEIYEKLTSIGNGRDVCLLTYEDSYNTDNVRNILIGWFTNAGLPCEEIKFRRNEDA